MNGVVVSDLHVGSRHFVPRRFMNFLEHLHADTMLVLNGDTVHRPPDEMQEEHRAVIDALVDRAERGRAVWIEGNHDEAQLAGSAMHRSFVPSHVLDGHIHISHGEGFTPAPRPVLGFLHALGPLRIPVRGEYLLSVRYIKRIPLVFDLVRELAIRSAVRYALANGFDVIVCGHLHVPVDRLVKGVRYLNTGTWTESPAHFLQIDGRDLSLQSFE